MAGRSGVGGGGQARRRDRRRWRRGRRSARGGGRERNRSRAEARRRLRRRSSSPAAAWGHEARRQGRRAHGVTAQTPQRCPIRSVSPRLASPARRAPVPRRRRAHFRFYVLSLLPSILGVGVSSPLDGVAEEAVVFESARLLRGFA